MIHQRTFFLSWVFLFVGIVSAFAQHATVKVKVENIPFGVNHFSVVSFKDYISLAPEFLAEKTVPDNSIELEFPLSDARWLRVTGLGLSSDFIAIPGNKYRFVIESTEDEKYINHITTDLPASDPNRYCDSVNILINQYLYKYNTQLLSGFMAKQTSAFCDSVEQAFVKIPHSLFQTFLSFRLDELRLMSKAMQEPNMHKERFEGRIFQPENPDYAYAFSEFYKGRFIQALLTKKMTNGKTIINNMLGKDTLVKLFAGIPFYGGEVGEGAMLLGLTELLKDKTYSRDGILFLFSQFEDSSHYESVRNLAGRLYIKYRTPVGGEQAPTLQVEDKTGRIVDVGIDKTRRSYLCFFDPASAVVPEELAALNELKKVLKDDIIIIPVIINADQATLTRMQSSLKLSYDLYRNIKASTLVDFRIKSDCTCMVLAPDGKYVAPSTIVPTAPDAQIRLVEFAKTGR